MTKIGAYPVERMTSAQKSRWRNPESVYPHTFVPLKNGASFIDIPEHKVAALEEGDQDTYDMVREEFYKKGLRGSFQIRAARGGVGAGRHMNIKIALRTNREVMTQGKGFPLIVREMVI
jgi:hypothetical protein